MAENCGTNSEIQTLLLLCGFDNIYSDYSNGYNAQKPIYKLVYKNENSDEISICLIADTTFAGAALKLTYKDLEYRIVSEGTKSNNLSMNVNGNYGIYDKANVWTVRNGLITGNYFYENSVTCPHFTEVTDFPVFEGNWTVDTNSSTELGIQKLSCCLVDAN